jgi:hypothetical protein
MAVGGDEEDVVWVTWAQQGWMLAGNPVPRDDPHELVQPGRLARTILKRR